MGLAGQKNRTKLSKDPNNTTWAKSTDTYGHKILRSQGWQPGDYLGARDANHADHYTTANASHIRVLLRDDNLGLGAQKGKGNAETFGLSLFSGLLGRLNGKSDEDLQKQQSAQRDVELRSYTSQKYGFMNFVRGGLLVGDKIEEYNENVSHGRAPQAKSKKRKLYDGGDSRADSAESASQKKRKEETLSGDTLSGTDMDRKGERDSSLRKQKKEKRRRKDEAQDNQLEAKAVLATGSSSGEDDLEAERKKDTREDGTADTDRAVKKAEKRRLREEKRARKEERRRRKAEKHLSKDDENEVLSTANTTSASALTSADTTRTSTPQPSSIAFGGGRHAVRQRYIQQKRLASMNARSLNEIFMLKSSA